MRIKEYFILFLVLVFISNAKSFGQSLTTSIELNSPNNTLANWEKDRNSVKVNISNKTDELLLATFYIEIRNQDGAIANNGELAGEFIELRRGDNTFRADKLLPAFGINYIRGLPNNPLEGGNYEICINIDISSNAIEGETLFKACNQWEIEQTDSSVTSPQSYSGGTLRSPQDNFEVTQVQNRAIRFSWSSISPTPNFSVTYMLLVYQKNSDEITPDILATQSPILELPVVGTNNVKWPSFQPLLGNGEYVWTVRPVNGIGESLLPSPGVSELRSFSINCDIRKLLPKTRDGLFALTLPIPSDFSLLGNQSQSQICWESLPLPGLTYQLNYTKAICDSIISDDSPYPFPLFIPSNATEEAINQATQEVNKVETELKEWQDFARKHVQRFVWTEQELETWENTNKSLISFSRNYLDLADTLNTTLGCDKSEICCGDNDCCKGLNPCFKSERELFLSRLICMEEQTDRLRQAQLGELIGLLGVFTRQYFSGGKGLNPEVSTAYFQIYSLVLEMLSYFENKNLQQHRAFVDVLNNHPNFKLQAPTLYKELVSAPSTYWQSLNKAVTTAERNKKLLPSSLLVGLEEYVRHISPDMNDVMGKTRSKSTKSLKDYLQNSYTNNQCLIAFNIRKKEHLEACQDFALQVAACLENERRKGIEERNTLIEESVKLREAYWNSTSDSIQIVFQEAVKELGNRWKRNICTEGGQISLPGAQTPSAVALKEVLSEKLGRKMCYLNFTVQVDCIDPEKAVTLTHSYPLLRRNENCCNSETELSWQSEKIVGGESKKEICLTINPQNIVETFNKQLSILNPKAPKLNSESIYAGRWSLNAFDSSGVMQAYSPTRVLELEVIQENDLMLELRDTTNCGCNIKALMGGKSLSSSNRMLITQPGKVQKFSITGDCKGGCPIGPTYVSIIPPPIPQMVNGSAMPISLPLISFHESNFDYNFPQTGIYRIQIKQVCNGYVCTEEQEIEVRPVGKVSALVNEWVEQTSAEKDAFCLSGFYKTETDSTWNNIPFQYLDIKEKTRVNFLMQSTCTEDCEEIAQYQWKLIDPNGKEQAIGESLAEIEYYFKKTGTYKMTLIETSSCTEDSQSNRQQSVYIVVSK